MTRGRQLRVPASACMGLEDLDAGIQAAHAAGMRPVIVPDLKPPSPKSALLAFRICASLREVQVLLEPEAEITPRQPGVRPLPRLGGLHCSRPRKKRASAPTTMPTNISEGS